MKNIVLIILLCNILNIYSDNDGTPVYTGSQCIGSEVNGVCYGTVIGAPVATCYGEMINGVCTGPMF